MSTIQPLGSVGAALSQVRFQAEYQIRALKEQQIVTEDLGSAALKLVVSALNSSRAPEHDLDVEA